MNASEDSGSEHLSRERQFCWYELITSDAESAKTFYSNVMGWGVLNTSIPDRGYSLFTAGTMLAGGLMNLPENTPSSEEAAWIGYIAVGDVDATASRIEQLGGTVHVAPREVFNISRYAIFADPQTARLGLLKWAKPMQQKPADLHSTGRVGWHELLAADTENAWTFYNDVFGWQRAEAEIGDMGTYQLFSSRGQTTGGIVTEASIVPSARWLYYFNVGDIRMVLSGARISIGTSAMNTKAPTPSEIKTIVVHVGRPTDSKPAGVSTEGYYKVVGDEVVMCKPNGEPVNIDGKQFRKRFGNKSGEFNERETASRLTLEIRSKLKHGGDRRPDGFDGAIHYPKGFY